MAGLAPSGRRGRRGSLRGRRGTRRHGRASCVAGVHLGASAAANAIAALKIQKKCSRNRVRACLRPIHTYMHAYIHTDIQTDRHRHTYFFSHMRFRTGSIQPECQNDASNIWRRYHRYVELGQVIMQEIVNFEQSQQNVEGRFPIQSDMFLLSRI